jgi:hypothetical protein
MRAITIGIVLLQILLIGACSTPSDVINLKNVDLKEFVGRKITIVGKTVNMKLGAGLELDNGERIWMDEMDSWPQGYYTEKESKSAQVTGILIERYDLPVFIPSSNDSTIMQGISVPKGTDIKEAKHRYIITRYTWNEIK